jgi:hypothetical protein
MDRRRAEIAIRERTRRMLGLARSAVRVSCWDGADGLRSTHVYLEASLARMDTAAIQEWMAYLDAFAPGRVSIWTNRLQSDIKILD